MALTMKGMVINFITIIIIMVSTYFDVAITVTSFLRARGLYVGLKGVSTREVFALLYWYVGWVKLAWQAILMNLDWLVYYPQPGVTKPGVVSDQQWAFWDFLQTVVSLLTLCIYAMLHLYNTHASYRLNLLMLTPMLYLITWMGIPWYQPSRVISKTNQSMGAQ